MSVRYLEPPPLPAASVFAAPPPLLRLPQRRPEGETQPSTSAGVAAVSAAAAPADAAGYTIPAASHNTALPAEASPVPQPSSTAPEFHSPWEATPYAQVPREPTPYGQQMQPAPSSHATDGMTAAAPQPTNTQPLWTAPSTLPLPELKDPILSPSELSDFRRYTDELKSKGTAAFLPVPVPGVRHSHAATSQEGTALAGAPLTTGTPPTPFATSPAALSGYASLLDQHNTFLQKVEQALHKQETDNEQFHQRLVAAVQRGSLGDQPRAAGGLSPVEQSNLVQNTIKQKNDLMNLNQQLLDIQLHAARSAAGVPATPKSNDAFPQPQSKLTVPSFFSSTAAPIVPTVKQSVPPPVPTVLTTAATQTTPVAVCDTAVEASSSYHPTEKSVPAPPAPVDTRAAKSVTASMADLDRLNAELLSMNASAGAMEHAIAETRDVIAKYDACRSMDAANAVSAAMMASLRYKTEAAERRLAEMTGSSRAPVDAAKPLTAPWSTLHRSASMSDAQLGQRAWLAQSSREEAVGCEVAIPSAAVAQPTRTAPESRQAAPLAPPPSFPPQPRQLPAPSAQRLPPPPPVIQSHQSGPLAPRHPEASFAAATFLTGPRSAPATGAAVQSPLQVQPQHGPSASRSSLFRGHARALSPAAAPPPTSPWTPSRRPAYTPQSASRSPPAKATSKLSTHRPLSSTEQVTTQRRESQRSALDHASSVMLERRPTDLSQLYATGRRHPSEKTQVPRSSNVHSPQSLRAPSSHAQQTQRSSIGGRDRFSMYRAPSTPRRHRALSNATTAGTQLSGSPEPPRPLTSFQTRIAPLPESRHQSLEASVSRRFEVRQQNRRTDSLTQRMAQLEADLFG